MSMGRTLKGYFFWTHERGSFHYDVMVTLILAFIFITPHLWNYGDRPQLSKEARKSILVQAEPGGGLVFDVPAKELKSATGQSIEQNLTETVAPISGSVIVDHYAILKDSTGHTTGYRLWARRP